MFELSQINLETLWGMVPLVAFLVGVCLIVSAVLGYRARCRKLDAALLAEEERQRINTDGIKSACWTGDDAVDGHEPKVDVADIRRAIQQHRTGTERGKLA